jgi:lipid II:glycine glycyltransferase (peptidoglycan interpeptide bridge formation enzyme)
MIEWNWTTDKEWFDKWDNFNATQPRGHYLQYSDWGYSYREYGFDVELLLGMEHGEICIGYYIVKAKFSFFKFYTINCGPVVKEGYENYIEESIGIFLKKAKKEGACYCHINLPVITEGSFPYCLPADAISENSQYFSGIPCKVFPFKFIASINGFSWIDLRNITEEACLNRFNANKRRDIRASLRKGLTVVEAKTPEEVREAYRLCELNATERGYPLRKWAEFKNYLLPLHEKGYGEFIMAYKDGDCKGALFIEKLPDRYHYVIGGAKKEKPDLLVGTYLHWQVIKKSIEIGFTGYDNSVGGTTSVRAFKDSFDPQPIRFIDGRYWILSPFKYNIYAKFLPYVRKNKQLISKVLKLINRK